MSGQEECEEDRELLDELHTLIEKLQDPDLNLVSTALDMLKHLIRTSTTSMTSVPKPLKYLAPHYDYFKQTYKNINDVQVKQKCADIISVLAMGTAGGDNAKMNRDCLNFCELGTKNISDWGHEYIRQLEGELVDEWLSCPPPSDTLVSLCKQIVQFDCKHHAEIQACDMLMEINQIELLPEYIDKTIYQRICLYLFSCVKYVEDVEAVKILRVVIEQYIRFKEYTKALIAALQLSESDVVNSVFALCKDKVTLKQMAFIAVQQLFPVQLDPTIADYEEIQTILNNSYLNYHFHALARELDIMDPKTPEDVYKTWLEPIPIRPPVLGVEMMNSARQNLAASFVNGFVNAGFGCDKLLIPEGNKWIYRNKDYGMLSTTASLGLIHLWDVDGGLTPIDKYFYSADEYIKSGALLGVGIVNCRVKNDCDPAKALLSDYIMDKSDILRIGAILGLGIAYIGTNHDEVLSLLLPAMENSTTAESLAIISLACGMISVGSGNPDVANAILVKLVDYRESEQLKSPYMTLVALALGMVYMGLREVIHTTHTALEVLPVPFTEIAQNLVQMCAYAGTNDMLVIQELLEIASERVQVPVGSKQSTKSTNASSKEKDRKKTKRDWNPGTVQAVAALAAVVVSIGEDIGSEMFQRILGNMGRYGDTTIRRIIPVCIALTSISRPHLPVIDVLTKYAHDSDDEVSCNAIFCLGIVGGGTNNARLAAGLRQLAVFHMRNPAQLFMVRLAQGLIHMGKGTLTICPLHTERQLMDYCAMAGLLVPLVCLLDTQTFILGENHYLLYTLAAAMRPRWLFTLDENLEPLPVTVRVGQAIDTVAKAGTPKTITGVHTHSTPVLLAAGERAELATDQYEQLCPTLDGVCILKKKPQV